jgi:hypothetical protein
MLAGSNTIHRIDGDQPGIRPDENAGSLAYLLTIWICSTSALRCLHKEMRSSRLPLTPDQRHRVDRLQPELEVFLNGWWSRAEQFRALLTAADGPVTIRLGSNRDGVYIRARHDQGGWLVEAASNNHLPTHVQLSVDAEVHLIELGWGPPTGPMPDFFRFYDDPVDLLGVAADIMIAFAAAYNGTFDGPFWVSPAHLIQAIRIGEDARQD